MIPESEYRKMEKELRDFCKGNPMVRDREGGYSRGRISTPTRIRKREEPGTRKTMGGIGKISRIRRVIRVVREIFSEGVK